MGRPKKLKTLTPAERVKRSVQNIKEAGGARRVFLLRAPENVGLDFVQTAMEMDTATEVVARLVNEKATKLLKQPLSSFANPELVAEARRKLLEVYEKQVPEPLRDNYRRASSTVTSTASAESPKGEPDEGWMWIPDDTHQAKRGASQKVRQFQALKRGAYTP